MKLEQNDKQLLFSETILPDVFFTDYLSQLPGDYVKIYLHIFFLSKFKKDIKVNDLSKKLSLPIKTITEGITFLEDSGLLVKKPNGYIIVDLQELTLNNLYKPNLDQSKEAVERSSKNKARTKTIETINNRFFQGIMGPSWFSEIDLWFKKYNFDDDVMFALFNECFNHGALTRPYVKTVAESWGNNNIKTFSDLENYSQNQEHLRKIKNTIAKKMGKRGNLTEYEEGYIESWVKDFGYDMDIIEIALKRTVLKQNPTLSYVNNIISDWHERNLSTPEEIESFLRKRKETTKSVNDLKKKVSKANYEQRKYDNLDFLYANNIKNDNKGDI